MNRFYNKIRRVKTAYLFLLGFILAYGCASSTRFNNVKTEVPKINGLPVEAYESGIYTKIPEGWLFVEDDNSGSSFTFTDKEINSVIKIVKINGNVPGTETEDIISLIRSGVKSENGAALKTMSETAGYNDASGFHYTLADGSFYNLFIMEKAGNHWQSILYTEPGSAVNKEKLITTQYFILNSINRK